MTLKKLLESLLEEKAPGPSPSFSVFHLIKALELIAKTGPIGRGKISQELKTGEGATRTLIERLKDAGLVAITKPGCSLTKKGDEVWNDFKSVFPQKIRLEEIDLTLAPYNTAVQIKNRGEKVKAGVEQRDAAIMSGAKGATTLIFRNKKLVLPTISENVAQDFPLTHRQISKLLKLEENDVVVIASADSWEMAEYGALAAAWTLIQGAATIKT